MAVEHEYCGECIFCTSKCLDCGSTSVEVEYSMSGFYQNDMGDMLNLTHEIENLKMSCNDCGSSFGAGDKGLNKLKSAIKNALAFPTFLTMDKSDENGKIKINKVYVTDAREVI